MARCAGGTTDFLAIEAGAVWSQPSKENVKVYMEDLGVQDAWLRERSGQLVYLLVDSEDPGVPASEANLNNWIETFDSGFFTAIEPTYTIGAQLDPHDFPSRWLIDLRTMKIVVATAGPDESDFWPRAKAVVGE